MRYVIGVDCGGSSTKAAAYDMDGALLHETKEPFGNLLIDSEKALVNIQRSIETIMDKLTEAQCQAIVLGIAGVDSGNFSTTVRKHLSKFFTKEIIILNDAWLAHSALLKGENGSLTIAGTGSISIGKKDEVSERVGGWGNLLGDEGSGYSIAMRAIKRVLDAQDKGATFTSLQQKIIESKSFSDVFQLVKFVYSSEKGEIAEVAMVVSKAADEGDPEALQLLKEAGEKLANQTIQCIEKLQLQEKIRIAVSGSVLLNNDVVYHSFESHIKETYTESDIIRTTTSNTIGGYYYYVKEKSEQDK